NLKEFDCYFELQEDGKKILEEKIGNIDLNPGESTEIEVPFENKDFKPDCEYFTTIYFALKNDTSWSSRGYVVAWEQFEIKKEYVVPEIIDLEAKKEIKLFENGNEILVRTKKAEIIFNKSNGNIKNIKYMGREILKKELTPNFWRVPIDNDLGNKLAVRAEFWKKAGRNLKAREIKISEAETKYEIKFKNTLESISCNLDYEIYNDSTIKVSMILDATKAKVDIPRIGMQGVLDGSFSKVVWYGRGPHENYCDRKTSAAIGIYSKKVEEMVHKYVRPQETGQRTEVRWFKLYDEYGINLLIVGIPKFEFSVWPFEMEDLEMAKHINELAFKNLVTVNIDYKQMGLGGDNSWGALPHKEYLITPGKYEYSFYIKISK
ncbi:MAG: beta-galactosidase, partial [Thermotogaceae bacterium]|nr:beta-galactosidase [Thermotogaceae bacterium]